MKKIIVILAGLLLLAGGSALAQTERFTITNAGWGRPEKGIVIAGISPTSTPMASLDVHRWRKTHGELVLDLDGKKVTVRMPRKELFYDLLTESYTYKDKNGWSYVDHLALENGTTLCRVRDCTHEDGTRQVYVLFNNFIQGYKILPEE